MILGEHSFKSHLLPQKEANILDLGCRGFEFANHFTNHNVFSVDLMDIDEDFPDNYYQIAISDKDGYCAIQQTLDPQATHIKPGNEIKMMTIKSFSDFVKVNYWDLIKMDIEGEEIKILKSVIHPIASQVTVEFHAHLGQTKIELDILLDWLSNWYDIYNRKWEDRYSVGFNYWDVLLLAK